MLAADGDNGHAVALGDLDGDGDLDAFVGNGSLPAGEPNRVYLNDGLGVFADVTATNVPAGLVLTLAVALGDVDVDGDLDAFVGTTTQDRLFVNLGFGVFSDATAAGLPTSPGQTRSVALGDLGNVGQPNRLYLNDGAGTFSDATAANLPVASGTALSVALGDVDADGDLHAFVGSAGEDRLLVNGGSGDFADVTATNLPAISAGTNAVALGDVDGDGDLDAILGNGDSFGGAAQNRLYLNDGSGVFADATATNLPPLIANTWALALGDGDEDGDLHLFLGIAGQSRFLLNGAGRVFSDVTSAYLPDLFDAIGAVAIGDLDGDGDIDALAGASGQHRLFTNLTRQLSWRGLPRAGKDFTLDLRGEANGTRLLAASPVAASLPVGAVGTLRLDPATLFLVAGGGLDPQGRWSLPVAVPAGPALVGFTLYWQALLGPSPRLTNLERTTVSGL